jgi:hypothetical protein
MGVQTAEMELFTSVKNCTEMDTVRIEDLRIE